MFEFDLAQGLQAKIWGNSLEDFWIALGIFCAVWLGLWLFQAIVLNRLAQWAEKTENDFDDFVVAAFQKISHFFYAFLAIYFTFKTLNLHTYLHQVLDGVMIILAIYEGMKLSQHVIEFGFSKTMTKKNEMAVHAIQMVAKIVLWSVGFLLVLSNLGFDITALAASMGIGGIALALAAQNILSDLFASFSIYFDKPFQIGDYIYIGADRGVVKKIGLKTTRLQTLQGEELIVSNQELTTARVQNFKKMKRRRQDFNLGVEYGTPTAKLKKIPGMVEKIVTEQENADFFRAHFTEFGDFSLNFSISYHINSGNFTEALDIQHAINLAIKESFEKEKISMAFPTQTIHMHKA
jgi:small-conductance mechanosensitive channel